MTSNTYTKIIEAVKTQEMKVGDAYSVCRTIIKGQTIDVVVTVEPKSKEKIIGALYTDEKTGRQIMLNYWDMDTFKSYEELFQAISKEAAVLKINKRAGIVDMVTAAFRKRPLADY